MNKMSRLVLATLLCAAWVPACSTVPSVEVMRTDPRCHAWTQGALGHAGVEVIGDRSHIYGTIGKVEGAFYLDPERIAYDGTFGQRQMGTYHPPQLIVHGAFGDLDPIEIGPRRSVVRGALGSLVVEYNDRCTDREAALGVVGIVIVAASQHHP
jgi:hypothetical protein